MKRQTKTAGRRQPASARPASPAPTPEQIQKRANEISEARGGVPGRELQDWLLAAYELMTGIEQQTALSG